MISDKVEAIQKGADHLNSAVKTLSDANKEIVESIQTISAITEEVTAHAAETHETSIYNRDIVGKINSLVEQSNENAQELKAKN